MPVVIAHRGFSSRQPEMTRAAYQAAIDWAAETRTQLELECDVQFSADHRLICLHDLTLDRTSNGEGRAYDRTAAQLKKLDFGSWRVPGPTADQRELVTLRELMIMVRRARRDGVPVRLAIETKHPSGRGRDVEQHVADLLAEFGWDHPDAPVRLMSFSVKAIKRFGWLLPALSRTLLIEDDLGEWRKGKLPDGVRVVGVDLELIRDDPKFVSRMRKRDHEVYVWTVNEPGDIVFCRELGVTGFITDYPERVAEHVFGTPYSG